MCVCLTLSAERVRLPLPLAEVSAETCVCVWVHAGQQQGVECVFPTLSRALSHAVCKNMCHSSPKRAEIPQGRWASGYWAARAGEAGTGGREFCESAGGLRQMRKTETALKGAGLIAWAWSADERTSRWVWTACSTSEHKKQGTALPRAQRPRIWSSMCLLMAELFCQNTVKAYQRLRLWSFAHTRIPTHALENWDGQTELLYLPRHQCLISQNKEHWLDSIHTLIRGISDDVQCCLCKMFCPR